ncbi:hypothetical protein [Pseudomonas aeruginosa]|nr:hypothetical protein [Pseudomonas aeruginosa]
MTTYDAQSLQKLQKTNRADRPQQTPMKMALLQIVGGDKLIIPFC